MSREELSGRMFDEISRGTSGGMSGRGAEMFRGMSWGNVWGGIVWANVWGNVPGKRLGECLEEGQKCLGGCPGEMFGE